MGTKPANKTPLRMCKLKFRKGMDAFENMLITHQWKRHRQFLSLLEPQLDDVVRDWELAIQEQAEQIDDDKRDEFYEFLSDEYHDMEHHRSILTNSFFTASFALFEYHLTWLCSHVQQRHNNPFSVNDLKYSLTNRVKSYLKKLGVPFPDNAPEWKDIIKYQEIRNKIMHEGGNVSCEWAHLKYAECNGIVSNGGEPQKLELTRSFCEKATGDFERFLLMVSHAARQTTQMQSDS